MTAFLRDWSCHNSGPPAPINHPGLPPLVGCRLWGMGSRTLEASVSTPPVTQPPPPSSHTPHFPSPTPHPPPTRPDPFCLDTTKTALAKVTLAFEVLKSTGNFELLFFSDLSGVCNSRLLPSMRKTLSSDGFQNICPRTWFSLQSHLHSAPPLSHPSGLLPPSPLYQHPLTTQTPPTSENQLLSIIPI